MSRTSCGTAAGASVTLVTLSLVLCLGAAAEAGAATMPRAAEPGPRPTLTANQREALASLLAQLKDAARDFHRVPHQPQPATVPPHAVADDLAPQPRVTIGPDRPRSLPTPPLRPGLLNLPPPAAC
ncbi:MAG: hypothetical protein ACODAQ_10365 [Phycisphaeraceae bacterium]